MDKNSEVFRIIVIDDNPSIHRDFKKILTVAPIADLEHLKNKIFGQSNTNTENLLPQFEIDTATQGQEGVAMIEQALKAGRPYSLAFVDIRMPPGWDGIETIKHIWQLDKDIQVVICTAFSDYSWEETVAELGQTDNLLILKKPFDNIAVRQLASALTKKWQLLQDARHYTLLLEEQVVDRTLSLQKSLSLVKATFESSNDGILVVSNEGKIIDFNQKLITMFQIPRGMLEEKDKILIYIKNQLAEPDGFFKKINELSKILTDVNIDIVKLTDGRIFECYSQPQKLNEKIIGRIFDFRDVTNRIKLEEELQFQATHDALTGVPNRVMLLDRIRQAIKQSEQEHTYFALLFLDLDRFKLINDSLSHAVGDELLQTVSNRLQSIMRPEDTLARLGGDEFVIVLTHLHNKEDAIAKTSHVLNIFQQPFKISNREVTVTASIGVSLYPLNGKTIDELLRNADAAMYCAKDRGANRMT